MTTIKVDPNRWAVSKNRNRSLAQPLVEESETHRFKMVVNTVRDLHTEAEVVSEIDKLWGEAQEKFLAIGRYLVQAKLRFHRSYEASILPLLPFGKGVAYQLRAIAVAVDEGRLVEDEMPRSYATAYQLVSLSPPQFDLARKENLIRRDVLRREVEAFRVRFRNPGQSHDREALQREKDRLETEAGRIAGRLAQIALALTQFNSESSTDVTRVHERRMAKGLRR